MIHLRELGVYTFPEKKCQSNESCWLLINLGALHQITATLPSGRQLFALTESQPFALLFPAGSCFDFDYRDDREDWVIELPVGTIAETTDGKVRLGWEGLQAETAAYTQLGATQAERARALLTRMLAAFHNPEPQARLTLHLAFHALLDCMLHPDLPLDLEDPAEALRRRIIADRRFVRHLSELSLECGYSTDHLRRLFEARFGVSPKAFRTNYRMHLAQDRLRLRQLSVQEVAEQLGYGHPAHFSTAFKKHVGQSPKAWKAAIPSAQS
jgi:AraC-like DNA-binding protein